MGFQDILIVPAQHLDIPKNIKRAAVATSKVDKNGLTIDDFVSLARNKHFKRGHVHEILEKSEIHLISTPPEPRNPELEARIQKLKAEQANEEYKKMTRGLYFSEDRAYPIRNDVRLATSQITAVINFVLTVGGSFFFAYKAVEYALPESHIPAQVMMGIVTATAVALADLYFLARTI